MKIKRDKTIPVIETALVIGGLGMILEINKITEIQANEINSHKPLIEQVQTQRAKYLETRHTALSKNSEQREKFSRTYSEHLNDVYGDTQNEH